MKSSKFYIRGSILVLILSICSGCISKAVEKGPEVMALTDNNYRNLVIKHPGPVLVYFSDAYSNGNIIKTEFDSLFEENNDIVQFGQYEVGSNSTGKYNVSKLPAVNYYYNGVLVDQLATLPMDAESQLDLAKDIQLWFYETVLTAPNYEKQFTYVFKGDHKLDFYPY